MLTSTYTLVALSVEQARVRLAAKQLLDSWSPAAWTAEPPALQQLGQACDALDQFVASCTWRKLDRFVLPALRRLPVNRHQQVQSLLIQLDNLAHDAQVACACARRAALAGEIGCLTWLERCCALVLARIEREEHELVLVARSALTLDDWRAMSHRMLAHDVQLDENRSPQPAGTLAAQQPAAFRPGAYPPGAYPPGAYPPGACPPGTRAPVGRPPPEPAARQCAPGAYWPANDVAGSRLRALPTAH